MDQTTDLLTARELGKRFRVAPDTVREWARRGSIPTVRLSRKVIRFDLQAVLAALSAARTKAVAHAK
jgi:excisionase family DNA binding protein